MITERIDLWKPEEYSYPLAFGFKPNLRTYLHEDDEIRPAMVVVPGGAYAFVSPTEAGIIAEKFYDFGYNAFVVTYTVNPLGKEPLLDQPARDLSRAIRIVRSKKFGIKPMYPEDACVEMELLGHSFYVFMNAETDQINVVYKRKGNTYGLIEPEA